MNNKSYPIAEKPSQIADIVWMHLKNGDMWWVVSMFHPDCQIFFPPTEPALLGHDGVKKAFADMIVIKPILESTITSEVIIADTALLHADWLIKNDNGEVIWQWSSTEVARKWEHGWWLYYIDCPMWAPKK